MPTLIRFFSFDRNLALTLLTTLILFYSIFINSSFSQERVYTYSSVIQVLSNRSLDVTETITVVVENKKIRHGIYRDFETFRVNQNNKKVKVDLKIISVKRNGVQEQFHTRNQGDKIRVFFGSKNKLVSKGIQTYIFHYITNNQLNAYNNKDEFYWNASGNKWSMPIFRVEATVVLPSRVKRKSITFNAYSGYTGVNKQDYVSSFTNNHTIKFALNRKYLSGNGLTISIAWPSGFIDAAKNSAPKSKEKINFTTSNNELKNINNKINEVRAEQSEIIAALKKTLTENRVEIIKLQQNTSQTTGKNNRLQIQEPIPKYIPESIMEKPLFSNIKAAVEELKSKTTSNTDKVKNTTTNENSTIKNISQQITVFMNKLNSSTFNNYIGLIGLIVLLTYFSGIQLFRRRRKTYSNVNSILNDDNIPENLSPASIRYINEMGYDDRTFAIALINIAVKGHIDIINSSNGYKIERRDFSAADELSKDESLLLNALLGNEYAIQLDSKNHVVIHNAMTEHKNLLEKVHWKKYFSTNKKSFNIGIALILLTGTAIAFFENNTVDAAITFSLLFGFAALTFLISYLLLDIFNYYKNFNINVITTSSFYKSVKESKEAYVFALLSSELTIGLLVTNYINIINLATIGGSALLCAIFSEYLISPNSEGKNILNKITNLKEFITHGEMLQTGVEYDSIQISQKISAFDNYLPYTIALGVESEWGDHYSLLFDHKNNDDDILGYSPHWYHGKGWKENNTTGFCESLSSKFSFSAASAAKTPKHSFDTVTSNTKH